MTEKRRKLLTLLLAITFGAGLVMMLLSHLDGQESQVSYESAVELASQSVETAPPATEPPTEPATEPVQETLPPQWVPAKVEEDPVLEELESINLEALREENPDVVGWISIPQTNIHYPVTQGEDNSYYLEHTWDQQRSFGGGIFLECQNSRDLSDFNTILYGHNMRNGSMFADLHDFSDPQFAEEHPYVYLVTEEGIWRYEIFASFNAPVDSKIYGLSFRQRQTREEFLQYALENTQIQTGITPAVSDRILTLSTCTGLGYSARRVVLARLPMVLEYP